LREDKYTNFTQPFNLSIVDKAGRAAETIIHVSMGLSEHIVPGASLIMVAWFLLMAVIVGWSTYYVFAKEPHRSSLDFRSGLYLVRVWKLKESNTYKLMASLITWTVAIIVVFILTFLFIFSHPDAMKLMVQHNVFGFVVQFIALNKLKKSQNVVPKEMYEKYQEEMFPRDYSQLTENNNEFAIRVCRTILAQNAKHISKKLSIDVELLDVKGSSAIFPSELDNEEET